MSHTDSTPPLPRPPRRPRHRRQFDIEAFREARETGGWSLVALADATDISLSAISKLSQGKRVMPRPGNYRRIIRVMRLKPGDLLMRVPVEDGDE